MYKIPFNRPAIVGNELSYMQEAVRNGHISGDGAFTRRCSEYMERIFSAHKILLTPSCTDALEICALLLDLKEGDEVIAPSYSFVSTVNAFVLRGARPVFVDIRPDTLNMDENHIDAKISSRTKAIVLVHYAGVACEMDQILAIAKKHGVPVVEDAAQAVNSKYKGKRLGTLGSLGTYSFHETKNLSCGEGGALVVNEARYVERAEIIRQKGTNRNQFFRGLTDKYTWCDLGSSYVLSDLLAAFLLAQLEEMQKIHNKRRQIFEWYSERLQALQGAGQVRLPVIPPECETNYHMFYVVFESESVRNRVMDGLKKEGILSVFHFVPLHLSPMGKRLGCAAGDLPVTESFSARLLRLPFFYELTEGQVDEITGRIKALL